MKKIIKNIAVSVTLSLAMLSFISSCKKKTDDATPSTPMGTLIFHMHTNVDTNEVADFGMLYSIPVENSSTLRRNLEVSEAELYISNIELVGVDGSIYNVPNTVVLKVQPTEPYTIGNVPAGNYKSVRFYVGLDPTTDTRSLVLPKDSVLNKTNMWYGSSVSSGHVFVDFRGSIDTTKAVNAASLSPFYFRLGKNTNYQKVELPNQNFTVSPNQSQLVHIQVDYSKLFQGIDLTVSSNINLSSDVDASSANALKVANNIPSMFKYEY